MKLALSQIISGAIITISAVLYSIYGLPSDGFPTTVRIPDFPNADTFVLVHVMPADWVSSLHIVFAIVFPLLGLAVLGVGIAQYIKARNASLPGAI
jgi:hypothetical protein